MSGSSKMHPISVLPARSKRPPSAYAESVNLGAHQSFGGFFTKFEYAVLRDNFQTSTWISIGACLQLLLSYFLPAYASLLPASLLLGWRLTKTLLVTIGLKRNPLMEGVVPGTMTVHFPDTNGQYTPESAESPVCLILLGIRCNHPLGMFAPNFKTIFDYFNDNISALEAESERYGWLGMTGWLQSGDRASGSEQMMVGYFKNADYLHKFAHGICHRRGWEWWDTIVKENPHLSLMHETYMVSKKQWETVYINHHPTGLAGTSVPCVGVCPVGQDASDISASESTTTWVSPLVRRD